MEEMIPSNCSMFNNIKADREKMWDGFVKSRYIDQSSCDERWWEARWYITCLNTDVPVYKYNDYRYLTLYKQRYYSQQCHKLMHLTTKTRKVKLKFIRQIHADKVAKEEMKTKKSLDNRKTAIRNRQRCYSQQAKIAATNAKKKQISLLVKKRQMEKKAKKFNKDMHTGMTSSVPSTRPTASKMTIDFSKMFDVATTKRATKVTNSKKSDLNFNFNKNNANFPALTISLPTAVPNCLVKKHTVDKLINGNYYSELVWQKIFSFLRLSAANKCELRWQCKLFKETLPKPHFFYVVVPRFAVEISGNISDKMKYQWLKNKYGADWIDNDTHGLNCKAILWNTNFPTGGNRAVTKPTRQKVVAWRINLEDQSFDVRFSIDEPGILRRVRINIPKNEIKFTETGTSSLHDKVGIYSTNLVHRTYSRIEHLPSSLGELKMTTIKQLAMLPLYVKKLHYNYDGWRNYNGHWHRYTQSGSIRLQ